MIQSIFYQFVLYVAPALLLLVAYPLSIKYKRPKITWFIIPACALLVFTASFSILINYEFRGLAILVIFLYTSVVSICVAVFNLIIRVINKKKKNVKLEENHSSVSKKQFIIMCSFLMAMLLACSGFFTFRMVETYSSKYRNRLQKAFLSSIQNSDPNDVEITRVSYGNYFTEVDNLIVEVDFIKHLEFVESPQTENNLFLYTYRIEVKINDLSFSVLKCEGENDLFRILYSQDYLWGRASASFYVTCDLLYEILSEHELPK